MSKGWDEQEATALRNRLKQDAGISLDSAGDKYVRDEHNNQLVHIAAQPPRAEVNFLYRTAFAPPDDIIAMFHRSIKSLSTAWTQAT